MQIRKQRVTPRYRIDFALVVLTGNLTRYLLTRPLVEQDRSVVARWYPIRTWVMNDPLRILPGALRIRLRHLLDSWRIYVRPPADAVVFHAFETYYLYALLKKFLRRDTIIVKNPDGTIPGRIGGISGKLRALAVQQTDLFVPWSCWAARHIRDDFPDLPDEQLLVLHPGIDLKRWPLRAPTTPGERFRLLFVGGDLMRKGADTLLDAFEGYLSETCELHVATQAGYLPPAMEDRLRRTLGVTLYLDLQAGSSELQALFRASDAFVLPTNNDSSSWVALEAMAIGVPVIICPQGGIPDIVRDGETGLLIPPKDPAALADAVNRLRTDTALRERLIAQGRAHVEESFDAVKNTQRLLAAIKELIDARRSTRRKAA